MTTEQTLQEARSLLQSGRDEQARLVLLQLLQQEPDNEAALMMLGGAYFNAAMYAEAEMAFERLILIEPGRGQFSIALFNTLWKQQRTEEALEEIKRFMQHADHEKEKETIRQYLALVEQLDNPQP